MGGGSGRRQRAANEGGGTLATAVRA